MASLFFNTFTFTTGAWSLYGGRHVFLQYSKLDKVNTVFMTTKAYDRFSCLEGEGEVRVIQLQHATSPLDVSKIYTLNL